MARTWGSRILNFLWGPVAEDYDHRGGMHDRRALEDPEMADFPDDERVFAFGPGALWSFSQNSHLFLNAYFETQAKYRPEGERLVLRFVHHF